MEVQRNCTQQELARSSAHIGAEHARSSWRSRADIGRSSASSTGAVRGAQQEQIARDAHKTSRSRADRRKLIRDRGSSSEAPGKTKGFLWNSKVERVQIKTIAYP